MVVHTATSVVPTRARVDAKSAVGALCYPATRDRAVHRENRRNAILATTADGAEQRDATKAFVTWDGTVPFHTCQFARVNRHDTLSFMAAKATRNDDRHPALIAAENAPLDDVPETPEERAAVERSKEDFRAGRTFPGHVVSQALREGRLAELLKR